MSARVKHGYVTGECRRSDACYQMGCPNECCLSAHRRKVTAQRLTAGTRAPGRTAHVAEDARWLVEGGLSVDLAAARLGVTASYLRSVLDGHRRVAREAAGV